LGIKSYKLNIENWRLRHFHYEKQGGRKMKVLVLGGGGAMARAIAKDLSENPDVHDIIVGDIDLGKAKDAEKEIGSQKVSAKKVDILNHSELVKALKGVNVVANSSWYELNAEVMKAALETGSHYVDLGGLYYVTQKQMKLDKAFKKAGITAILGIGASPGMTNVLAGYGASKLDSVDEVHIRTGAKGGGGFAYSARTILDEVTMNPVIFENGEFKKVEPLSGKERYRLPSPVDEVEGFYSIHSELATLPLTIKGVKTVTFRVGFSSALVQKVNVLLELGLLRKEPIKMQGMKISPKDFLYAYLTTLKAPPSLDEFKSLQVEVVGKKGGETKKLLYTTLVKSSEKWNLRATAIWTGVPAAIATHWLGTGKIGTKGVLPPEVGIDPEGFIAELAKRDIVIYERGE
jgi:saccharopine dehydrogenase (NAD+, L-lysine-forming)